MFVCLFVCWNKTRKTILCLLCSEKSKPRVITHQKITQLISRHLVRKTGYETSNNVVRLLGKTSNTGFSRHIKTVCNLPVCITSFVVMRRRKGQRQECPGRLVLLMHARNRIAVPRGIFEGHLAAHSGAAVRAILNHSVHVPVICLVALSLPCSCPATWSTSARVPCTCLCLLSLCLRVHLVLHSVDMQNPHELVAPSMADKSARKSQKRHGINPAQATQPASEILMPKSVSLTVTHCCHQPTLPFRG